MRYALHLSVTSKSQLYQGFNPCVTDVTDKITFFKNIYIYFNSF
jgi:hypothetical protein